MPYNDKELLAPDSAAKILGVNTSTLAVWRCTKRYNLPYVKIGRLVKYKYIDVLNFIDNNSTNNGGYDE